jgi:GT2 family glycosyltransferase
MFDDKLFWMEDVDFCYRAKIEGAKVIYFPLTEIIHYSGESSKKNINASLSNQLISKIKFVKKHYSILTALIASIFIFVHIISRIAIFFCLSLTGRNFKVKRSAYFYSLKKYFNYVINKDEGIT